MLCALSGSVNDKPNIAGKARSLKKQKMFSMKQTLAYSNRTQPPTSTFTPAHIVILKLGYVDSIYQVWSKDINMFKNI